jgi:hypothetical protein
VPGSVTVLDTEADIDLDVHRYCVDTEDCGAFESREHGGSRCK